MDAGAEQVSITSNSFKLGRRSLLFLLMGGF